jgi:hypothetical protein
VGGVFDLDDAPDRGRRHSVVGEDDVDLGGNLDRVLDDTSLRGPRDIPRHFVDRQRSVDRQRDDLVHLHLGRQPQCVRGEDRLR